LCRGNSPFYAKLLSEDLTFYLIYYPRVLRRQQLNHQQRIQ
jgi:hypothetical protein